MKIRGGGGGGEGLPEGTRKLEGGGGGVTFCMVILVS